MRVEATETRDDTADPVAIRTSGIFDQMAQLGAHRTTATVRAVNNLRADLEAGTMTMRLMGEEGYLDTHLAAMERVGELAAPRTARTHSAVEFVGTCAKGRPTRSSWGSGGIISDT